MSGNLIVGSGEDRFWNALCGQIATLIRSTEDGGAVKLIPGIEIPSPHLEAGIVEPVTWTVPEEMRFITIRSSEKRPDDATVRIRFRDRWFYIDATDTRSKRAFLFLRTFIGMRLAESGAAQQAPVLTVPVN